MKSLLTYFKSFLILIFLLFYVQSKGTHIFGFEFSYECLGNDLYQVYITMYTDCYSVGLPNTSSVDFSSASCGTSFIRVFQEIASSPVDITSKCSYMTTDCDTNIGIGGYIQHTYSDTVTLSGSCSDWIVSKQTCCRSYALTNLANPGGTYTYNYATINPAIAPCNNSPTFVEDRPLTFTCIDDTLYWSFNAHDIDGDSLVYSLVDAMDNATTPVSYASGFSGQTPFIGTVTLDATTGLLTLVSNVAQVAAVCVQVDEYRNGVKISTTRRGLHFFISVCNPNNSPKLKTVNGISINDPNVFHYSMVSYTTLALNSVVYAPDVTQDTQIVTATWVNLPSTALFTSGATLTPNFLWSPTASDVGKHYFSLELEDNHCPYTARNTYVFEIEVLPQNSPPIAVDDYYTVHSNETLTIDFTDMLGNDFDIDNNNISFSNVITPPSNSSVFTITNSNIFYTPIQGFVGLDSFVYQICDNGSPMFCSQATVIINVDHSIYEVIDSMLIGTTMDICFNSVGLSTLTSTMESDSFTNATVLSTDLATGCMSISGDTIGVDTVVFLICDSNGDCVYNTIILSVYEIVHTTEQISLGHLVNVFPNPTSNIINIQAQDLEIQSITVSDISGQVILSKNIKRTQTVLATENLSNGIYTLSFQTDKGLIHKKINVLK